jgi:hypothetical protein
LFVAHPYLQHYAVSVCGTDIRRSEKRDYYSR